MSFSCMRARPIPATVGFEVGVMLFVYEQWKIPTKTFLSTWAMWSVAISLTIAPWLFNPQSLQVRRRALAVQRPVWCFRPRERCFALHHACSMCFLSSSLRSSTPCAPHRYLSGELPRAVVGRVDALALRRGAAQGGPRQLEGLGDGEASAQAGSTLPEEGAGADAERLVQDARRGRLRAGNPGQPFSVVEGFHRERGR